MLRSYIAFGSLLLVNAGIALADHVDDVVVNEMKKRGIPGLALAVIQNSSIIREQGYGYADSGRTMPVTPQTLFQAASVSKPVSALAALHLVEDHKVSLDEDMNRRLRSWHIPDNHFTKGHLVTLRLVLSHGAGLSVSGFRGYEVGSPIPSLLQILDGLPPANSPPIRVNETPGSDYRYSGGGYLVMQQMITDVTGESFPGYIDRVVLKPFGMTSSTFEQPVPVSWTSRAATGYSGDPPRPVPGRWHIKPELAAGGLWSTAGDLARLLIGVQKSLSGAANPVISQSMTREMLTRQRSYSGLGFNVAGNPWKFGHNGSNVGFDTVTVAFAQSGQGAAFMMSANTDIEVLKNILVEAVGDEYHWPGYPHQE